MAEQIGIIGLAVMGENLVLNLSDHGVSVAVYNRTAERTRKFMFGAHTYERIDRPGVFHTDWTPTDPKEQR